jgi:hypothetical protein
MAISLECRGCDHRWKVKDELAGRKTKCPECGKPTFVPDDEDVDLPPPKKSKRPVPRRSKRRKQGAPVALILSLVFGGIVLTGGGIFAVWYFRSEPSGKGTGIAGAVVEDNPNVTRENFKRIQRQMTPEQVEQILGKGRQVPRGEVSRAIHVPDPPGGFGNDTLTLKWQNKKDTLLLEFSKVGVMAGWYVTEKEDGGVTYILL